MCLTALLTSSASFLAYAQDNGDQPFPDVPGDHEYVQSIQFMLDNLVFEGYPDGNFQPDRILNRAEQLKVYMLLHGIDPSAALYNNCFEDVKDEWFARFICFAKEMGWVEGYPDGLFRPEQEVNKVEALKMLGEIQNWAVTNPVNMPFTDTPAEEWYAIYVLFAFNAGLLAEEELNGEFNPDGGVPRDYTAEMLFRSLAVYALNKSKYDPNLVPDLLDLETKELPLPNGVVMDDKEEEDIVQYDAEYGDAPESGSAGYAGSYSTVQAAFPTLFNTPNSTGPGAHTLDASMEWLGDPADGDFYSYEADADDPADPDGVMNLVNEDKFDDGVTGVNIVLVGMPPPATLTTDVTIAAGAPDVPRYLNVLIDLNMDGEWSGAAAFGEKEWAVQNFEVNVAPGTTESVTTDAFAFSNGNILTPTTWMRVLLTREPLNVSSYGADGWDGSGQFDYGEVEDYYVQLPQWDEEGGGKGGGPGGPGAGGRGLVWGKPAPVMVCPKKVTFPPGANWVNFRCFVYNFGGNGDIKYTLWRINGGVNVAPTTGTHTMPTAPPGFPPLGTVGNPAPFRFVAWPRSGTPSLWGYTVVGIDPVSTVSDSIVDLGLVPGEDDEGYEAVDTFAELTSWADDLPDDFLFGGDHQGPAITDVTLVEMDDTTADTYHWSGYAHARHPSMDPDDLTYGWEHSECGDFQVGDDPRKFDWWFTSAEMDTCLEGGLLLEVSDGELSTSEWFNEGFFVAPVSEEEEEPVNQAPVVNGLEATWMNSLEDDPHEYVLNLDVNDPDGDPLTFNWTGVDCGWFDGATDGQSVNWFYNAADMETCSGATATVQVGDGTDEDVWNLIIFP